MAIFFLIAMFLFCFSAGCREKKEFVNIVFDKELSYTMKTTEVLQFISDSGITRIKWEAKEWLVFDEASEPYQFFPEKIHAEKFDSLRQVEASFDADTAYYYSKKGLWKFIDNVKAVNFEGEQFETSLLFWDQNEKKIYSDQFIRITKGDFINTGIGFESNETLTQYRIFNSRAEIPIQENAPADTIDTLTPTLLHPN
jgi:LPS export ABC transporter protein LptC